VGGAVARGSVLRGRAGLSSLFDVKTIRVAVSAAVVSGLFRLAEHIQPNPFDPLIQAAIALYVIGELMISLLDSRHDAAPVVHVTVLVMPPNVVA
jgi:hypothetical protein